MSIYADFERAAEGVTVEISQPGPRWVRLSVEGGAAEFRISIKQAEGLQYALDAALRDARLYDERHGLRWP